MQYTKTRMGTMPVIPVPEEVIQRQEKLRSAREETRSMFGTPGPYEIGTPEYHFFVGLIYV